MHIMYIYTYTCSSGLESRIQLVKIKKKQTLLECVSSHLKADVKNSELKLPYNNMA